MLKFHFNCRPDTLVAMLCDPDFVVERSLAMGDLEAGCEVYEEGNLTVVNSQRLVERDLPAFLKRVLQPVQEVEVTENWRGSDGGQWQCEQRVVIKGVPLTLSARIEVVATDGGCCYQIRQSAKANLPLIGRRLETFSVKQAEDGVAADMGYVKDNLD